MLNRVPSHLTISTTNKFNIFTRRFFILTVGGASVVAALYWMFRRKNNKSFQKEATRRIGDQIETESTKSGTATFITKKNSITMKPNANDNLEFEQQMNKQSTQINSIQEQEMEVTTIKEQGANLAKMVNEAIDEETEKEDIVEQFAANVQKPEMEVDSGEQRKESGQLELGSTKMLTQPSSSSNSVEKQRLASLLDFILEPQPEFNWAEAVEAEERKTSSNQGEQEKVEKENSVESENNKMNGTMQMQHQEGKSPNALYSGRNSSSSVRQQHPVNSICTCNRCIETLNDLQSSRGYKNAESPHSTQSEGSADSGRATGPLTSCSPFAVDEFGQQSEILPIYEFEVPNTLVGLIIGIKGKTIRELCIRANVRMLIRPHHTPNKYETHQICSVEGRRDDINKCLHMIRLRFPPCRFPDLNLKPVLPPPPTTPVTARGTPTAQTLPVGVPCEVYISAHVDAGHFFLQLPTHPSFSSLAILDQYMLSVYTQPGGAPEIPKPCKVGVLCAAPAYNGWFRAITLAYEPEQDEVLVRFVDYGGFARLPRADLRQIRTDFMTLPMQAIECYLANVQPIDGSSHWSEKANELFQQLCVSKIIQAALLGYCKHDGLPCVELYVLDENKKTVRVDQMLLERGLAKPADPTILVGSSISNSSSS